VASCFHSHRVTIPVKNRFFVALDQRLPSEQLRGMRATELREVLEIELLDVSGGLARHCLVTNLYLYVLLQVEHWLERGSWVG